jgi:hypothetical protein
MATIKSQMVLNDGMSVVLKKITSALDTTLSSFEMVQRASGSAVDVANIEAARAQLADASRAVDDMADNYRRAAQEEERLNDSINRGASAMDGMVTKVVSLVGAYMSLSAIKNLATTSMDAANTQINAQVQLRTVLENTGAMDSYEALTNEVSGNELENDLTLNTAGALDNYDTFAAEVTGNTLEAELVVQADNSQALTAYDAIVQKAADIQGNGIYGDEIMIAGAAEFATYFEDANAILSMMDTLTDYAMGMSGGGALDATSMVDYATGLGKIMSGSYDAMTKKGFEFSDAQKAIIEGTATEAQIVAELGAEYLNMSSDMQAAAAINNVIAEGWGGLYETMSNTPEGKIISLNNTLGDIQEVVGAGIYPAVTNLVDTVQQNAPQIETAALGLATVLGTIINIISLLIDGALSFGTVVAENWSWIEPIIWGVVAALIAYNATQGIAWLTTLKDIAVKGAHAVASAGETLAILALIAAQDGLNAAMAACPITWIVVAVIALIAGLVALCNWIAKTTGVAQTGFGVITGGINVVMQFFVNLGLTVANIALGIWNALGACCSNIGTAFHNVIANVQGWFFGLLSTALTVVEGICAALNKLPFVEFDYSGISAKADEYAAKSAEAYGSVEDYTSVADAFSEGFGTFDAFSDGWASDAFNAGAAWGDGIMDKVGGFFDGLTYEPGTIDDYTNSAVDGFLMDGMGSDISDIAGNTGSMAKSLEVSGEELEYLRDIAERDAINRFTTAEVKIDMTGMTNKIDGGADLDGVIRELTDGFTEALVTAAEGVHA